MSTVETQFHQLESGNSWQKFFDNLRSTKPTKASEFATTESNKPESRIRNRFNDVLPYDSTRVILKPCHKKSSDYINASYVKVPSARRFFICAQGPLPETNVHFWEMIWHQNCPAIVMLNNLKEKGRVTCATYWPEKSGRALVLEDERGCHTFTISLVTEEINPVYATRLLNVAYQSKDKTESHERNIWHFHFTNWPDFGVPDCPDAFLDFLTAVRGSGCFDVEASKEESNPVVVHCTAGIGRTGTFLLVDVCLVLLSLYRMVDIPSQLLELRSMRMGMVQTAEQLRFCYQAIMLGKQRASLETPAITPVNKQRPATLELKPVPPLQLSPSCSFSDPPPSSPKSPRRELLRQDGRTPSLELMEQLGQQNGNGKRRRIDGINGDVIQALTEEPDQDTSCTVNTPPIMVNGESKDLSLQQNTRDAEFRQRRQMRNEKLQEKIKTLKQHQQSPPNTFWKPWMLKAAVGVCGLAIIFLGYRQWNV